MGVVNLASYIYILCKYIIFITINRTPNELLNRHKPSIKKIGLQPIRNVSVIYASCIITIVILLLLIVIGLTKI